MQCQILAIAAPTFHFKFPKQLADADECDRVLVNAPAALTQKVFTLNVKTSLTEWQKMF